MSSTNPNYPAAGSSWTATSIAASSIADAGNASTAAIDNDGKTATEVSVKIVYGGTATVGVMVYLLRDTDGTNYEDENSGGFQFEMPKVVSGTRLRVFTVDAMLISRFKIKLINNSGASVTATVLTQPMTVDTV